MPLFLDAVSKAKPLNPRLPQNSGKELAKIAGETLSKLAQLSQNQHTQNIFSKLPSQLLTHLNQERLETMETGALLFILPKVHAQLKKIEEGHEKELQEIANKTVSRHFNANASEFYKDLKKESPKQQELTTKNEGEEKFEPDEEMQKLADIVDFHRHFAEGVAFDLRKKALLEEKESLAKISPSLPNLLELENELGNLSRIFTFVEGHKILPQNPDTRITGGDTQVSLRPSKSGEAQKIWWTNFNSLVSELSNAAFSWFYPLDKRLNIEKEKIPKLSKTLQGLHREDFHQYYASPAVFGPIISHKIADYHDAQMKALGSQSANWNARLEFAKKLKDNELKQILEAKIL